MGTVECSVYRNKKKLFTVTVVFYCLQKQKRFNVHGKKINFTAYRNRKTGGSRNRNISLFIGAGKVLFVGRVNLYLHWTENLDPFYFIRSIL